MQSIQSHLKLNIKTASMLIRLGLTPWGNSLAMDPFVNLMGNRSFNFGYMVRRPIAN